jgi:hypothetical protein
MNRTYSPKFIAACIVIAVVAMIGWRFTAGLTGKNDLQSYQIWQGVGGDVKVIDTPGYYWNWFGTAWTYPKSVQAYWSASPKEGSIEDESIRVTFNDGGTAKISAMVQFSMPLDQDKRQKLHAMFGGNLENIKHAVHAHLVNCVKNTGPLMSASENQAARKSEFAQTVEDQLRRGLYVMKRTTVALKDRFDEKGQPIKVEATEIVKDEKGVAEQAETSPLLTYGIDVVQFSITGTDYDERTIAQFAAKQEAFLAAERSKAEREQEIQRKLMIEAQGLRQVAEIEAAANQAKAKAVTEGQQRVEVAMKEKEAQETRARQEAQIAEIQAQQRVAVALKEKEAQETAAKQKLAVAEIEKQTIETRAKQEAEVQRIAAEMQLKVAELQARSTVSKAEGDALAAAKQADGILALATAKAKEIDIAGAVKEHDKVLAEIERDKAIGVARELAKISVPQTIISGGGAEGKSNGQSMTEVMMGLYLMKNLGIIKDKELGTPIADLKK